jgi:glycosyltransferase involved in cell wall biosynthesis
VGTRRNIAADARRPRGSELIGPGDGSAPFSAGQADLPSQYLEARQFAVGGQLDAARAAYRRLLRLRRRAKKDARLRGLIHNDLAVLDAIDGNFEGARAEWRLAIEADGNLLLARLNRDLFEAGASLAEAEEEPGELKLVPAPGNRVGGADTVLLPPPLRPSPIEGEGDLRLGSPGRDVGSALEISGSARVSDPAVGATEGLHEAVASCQFPVASSRRSARSTGPVVRVTTGLRAPSPRGFDSPVRIAVLSFLFNWPSTGGGNMHTAGLVEFLGRAGYEVRHFYARFPAWGIGRVDVGQAFEPDACGVGQAFQPDVPGAPGERLTYNKPIPAGSPREALEFDEAAWNVAEIQRRYRRAVDEFQPYYVAITDAWNMKPHLAEAVQGYPVFLLFQAQECLCPLNNLRLLGVGPNQVEQCPRNQLATPQVCHGCLAQRGQHSGVLHQVERALAGVGTAEYDQKLRRALHEAEAVLALNPLTAAMLEPYARRVCIVPWGIDARRFPWPAAGVGWVKPTDSDSNTNTGGFHRPYEDAERAVPSEENTLSRSERRLSLFMAAVAGETIKGFHVAHEACRLLWESGHDFELAVTFDPPGQIDDFTRAIGWQSQAELPRCYREADICLVPTIAQDGLSITSVEAMASGLPVIASRIGGLPYTVTDGVTGLLCEPGDPSDLASKIARLMDDPALRREMGLAGRRRFETDFTWETVIERYWRPLLGRRLESRL